MSPLLIKISKDLKLVRCPRSLAPTLVALPSMSLIPQLHSRRDRSDRECGDFRRADRIARRRRVVIRSVVVRAREVADLFQGDPNARSLRPDLQKHVGFDRNLSGEGPVVAGN